MLPAFVLLDREHFWYLIRVFDFNAWRYRGLEVEKCFRRNEDEKKRHYNERITAVKNGTFTLLLFYTTGEWVESVWDVGSVQRATDFLRTKLSFSLLRSTLLCLRGFRSLKIEHNMNDLHLTNSMSRVGGSPQMRSTMESCAWFDRKKNAHIYSFI